MKASARTNLLKIAAIVLLMIIVSLAIVQLFKKKGAATANTNRPRCSGLKCYDNSDCGDKCFCDRPGSALGLCVAK